MKLRFGDFKQISSFELVKNKSNGTAEREKQNRSIPKWIQTLFTFELKTPFAFHGE